MRTTLIGTLAFAMIGGVATAHPLHHRSMTRHRAMPLVGFAQPQPYQSAAPFYRNSYEPAPSDYVPTDNSPTSIILRATIRAQSEPGVFSEIDPTGKQTATGGPSGGSPEFGGGT